MTNTLEYVVRLRDELSPNLRQAAAQSEGALASLGQGALVIAAHFDQIAGAAQAGFKALTGDYDALVGMISSIPGPIGAVGGAVTGFLAGAITSVAELSDKYDKLSQKTGLSVTFLSSFVEAADDVRVESDTAIGALEKFARFLGGAIDPMEGGAQDAKGFGEAVARVGVEMNDAEGKARPMTDVLYDVADRFAAMPDGAEKFALAVKLFGRSGAELIPALNLGSARLREMQQQAIDTGLAITDKMTPSMRALKASQDSLNDNWEAFTRRIGASVIPVLADATGGIDRYSSALQRGDLAAGAMSSNVLGVVGALGVYIGQAKSAREATAQEAEATAQANREMLSHKTAAEMAAEAERNAAAAAKALADNINLVTGAATRGAEEMNNHERITTALKLATGEMGESAFETAQATEALMAAIADGTIRQDDGIRAMKQLADKTLSAEDAFKLAGKAGARFADETRDVVNQARYASADVGSMGRAIASVPSNKTVTIGANVNDARSQVNDFQGYIDSVTGKVVDVGVRTYGKSTVAPGSEASLDDFTNYIYTYVNGKMVQVGASVTGKRSVVNGSEDSLEGFVNYVYTYVNGKMVQVGANVTGRGDLQNVVDNVNYLTNTYGTVAVTAQVTYYNGDSSGAGAYLAQPAARGTRSTPSGNVAINAPFSVTMKDVAAARALKRDIENTARRAQLRAAMGGL